MDLFLKKVQYEWQVEIQPILNNVFQCIMDVIENNVNPSGMFLNCKPVEIYTKIYNLTIHHQTDYSHLDFLYKKEIDSIIFFCSQYYIHNLHEIIRHVSGFQILIQWFHCFFHHLNRLQNKLYHNTHKVEEDIIFSIRDFYLRKQQDIISNLLIEAWCVIRKKNYAIDPIVLDVIKIISIFDPQYYNELFFLYYTHLEDYLKSCSKEWIKSKNYLTFMRHTNQCFQQEKKMFSYYFYRHQEKDYNQVENILKKILIYPYIELFLQDKIYGWKKLLHQQQIINLQEAYCFYSQSNNHTLWLMLYQEFLQEKMSSFSKENMITILYPLLAEQQEFLKTNFTEDKIKLLFITVLEKSIQHLFLQDGIHLTIQLVKSIHQTIYKKSLASIQVLKDLSDLIQYCPDKDEFYKHYHESLKERLFMEHYYLLNENRMLDVLETKFGMSFVLNLRLMLQEIQTKCVSKNQFHMFKLSKVVWGKPSYTLQYTLPFIVEKNLQHLYDLWRKSVDPLIKLENMWLEGSVVLSFMKTDFIMTPTQAIVLLALDEQPLSRTNLIKKINGKDDLYHNVDGILDSLVKATLIKQDKDNSWSWNQVEKISVKPYGKIFLSPVKQVNTFLKQQKDDDNTPVVVMEAWIIRKMKQENTLLLSKLIQHVKKQFKTISIKKIKDILINLVDREFLMRTLQDNHILLTYIP